MNYLNKKCGRATLINAKNNATSILSFNTNFPQKAISINDLSKHLRNFMLQITSQEPACLKSESLSSRDDSWRVTETPSSLTYDKLIAISSSNIRPTIELVTEYKRNASFTSVFVAYSPNRSANMVVTDMQHIPKQ